MDTEHAMNGEQRTNGDHMQGQAYTADQLGIYIPHHHLTSLTTDDRTTPLPYHHIINMHTYIHFTILSNHQYLT